MQIENELKYRINKPDEMVDKIKTLGFELQKKEKQEDYYFSPPNKNFVRTHKYYLRLRKENAACFFEYHVVLNDLQVEEKEVSVDNFDIMYSILKDLQFKEDCLVKKYRQIYTKDNINIIIDSVQDLGNFIEIEYIGDFNKKIKNKFDSLIESLNLKKQDLVLGIGYPDLLTKK